MDVPLTKCSLPLSGRKEPVMGGKNHQPCNQYLPNSTRLSKQMSIVTIGLENANIHLEDVILAELDGSQRTLVPVMDSLHDTERNLQVALELCRTLRGQMTENGYQDLLPLQTLDLKGLGDDMVARGLVEAIAWQKMSRMMKEGTFFANLTHFENELTSVLHDVRQLCECIAKLSAAGKAVNQITEKNMEGNFKEAFAKVFTHWLRFQQEFLASSIVSTEVYYASTGAGSLIRRFQTAGISAA